LKGVDLDCTWGLDPSPHDQTRPEFFFIFRVGAQLLSSSSLFSTRPDGFPSAHGLARKAKTFSLFKFDPANESVGSSGLMRAEDDTARWGIFSPQDFVGGYC
jgi:hypothetical protein